LLAVVRAGFATSCPSSQSSFRRSNCAAGLGAEQDYRGVSVRFAVRHDEADDLN